MASLLPRWIGSSSYNHLSKQEEPFLEKGQDDLRDDEGHIIPRERTSWWRSNIFLWITNVLFASMSFYLYLSLRQHKINSSLGSFEEGFTTEFAAVRGQIAIEHKMFWGAPTWSKEGGGRLLLDPNDRVFVGNISDEKTADQLDDNWEDWIGDRYFQITEDEAREAWGPGYQQYKEGDDTGYVAGLDVMHLLHCLNFIRQDFNRERYGNSKKYHHQHANVDPNLHRDHCFEALRESIACHADLAPIPSRWFQALGQNYIDTNRPHVCRNWDNIRSWVTSRVNGTLRVEVPKPGKDALKSS